MALDATGRYDTPRLATTSRRRRAGRSRSIASGRRSGINITGLPTAIQSPLKKPLSVSTCSPRDAHPVLLDLEHAARRSDRSGERVPEDGDGCKIVPMSVIASLEEGAARRSSIA